MNWLFGKRKAPPEVYVAEETPEGFVPVVTGTRLPYEAPLPPYPTLPKLEPSSSPYCPYPVPYPAQYPPGHQAPYPPSAYPTTPIQTKSSTDQHPANPLDSIPFVLNPSLSAGKSNNSLNVDAIRTQLNELRDRLDSSYYYDFRLEQSVMLENTTMRS